MKLRVAACQILTSSDVLKSTEKILYWIERAAEDNIDVVSFPEACTCGYSGDPEYWKNANPADFKEAEKILMEASARYNIAMVVGTPYWESGVLYNSLLCLDKGGVFRGYYSKTHLAEKWPQSGKTLPVYTLAGVKSCFIICHDVRYPELVRLPTIAGAQICYFCSNEAGLTKEQKLSAYRAMPISRATENSIFCVMANAPADAEDINGKSQSHGNSKIIDPDGNVIDEAGFFEERLVAATIDLGKANRKMALRSFNDDSILKKWMTEGAKLVTVEE